MATKSFERFYAWYEKQGDVRTLWRMDGPKRTDIDEVRMVMFENGDTAIITVFKLDNGFMVYRYAKD